MSFTPVIPLSGIAGWTFLQQTADTQRAAFDQSPLLSREIAYFEENIGGITSAEELVADRTLLKVALGAFGLDEELFKTAFIEQILAGGTDDPDSLANRFVDPRYADLADAFGFGNVIGARTGFLGFSNEITSAYKERQFEIAVGNQNEDMRLAMAFKRTIGDLADGSIGDATAWYKVLGDVPTRMVFEGAFSLPREFAGLDIDQQRKTLEDRSNALFGERSIKVFADPENVDRLIDRFLAVSQAQSGPTSSTPGYAALSLLQAGSSGSPGLTNLILSAR